MKKVPIAATGREETAPSASTGFRTNIAKTIAARKKVFGMSTVTSC